MWTRQISDISPVGTIAYLHEEEGLLVRIRKGWQYIAVSFLLFLLEHDAIYRPHAVLCILLLLDKMSCFLLSGKKFFKTQLSGHFWVAFRASYVDIKKEEEENVLCNFIDVS